MQSARGPAPLRGARHQVSGRNLLCEFATLLRPARPTATSSSPPVAASSCIASATTSQPYSPVSASASHQGRNTQRCAKFAAVGDRENHDHNVRALLVRKNQTTFSQVGLRVRIPLAPAESQSLGRIRVRGSRTPAFRAGVRGWLGDAVGRDAQGFPIRANLRQYLCRAIFQYRSAADVVGENATPIPTKSGLPRFNVRQIFEFGSGSGKAEHGALIVPSERQT